MEAGRSPARDTHTHPRTALTYLTLHLLSSTSKARKLVSVSHDDWVLLLSLSQAEFLFGKNVGPVPGRLLPPHPKNANISLTLSHTLLDAMETHITKQSTFQVSVDHRAYTALCGLPEVDVPVGSGCPSEINQQMATQVSEW